MSTGCLCFPSLNLNSINFGRAPVGDRPELNSGSSTERSASERRVRAVTITDRIFRSQRAVIHYHYPNSDEQATQSRSSRRSRRSFIRNRRNTSSNNESHSSPSSTGVTSACNVCASCPVGDEDGVDSSSTNMYLQLMPNDVKQLHVAVMKNDAITVGKLIEQGVDVNFPWVSEPNSCAVKHGISPLNEAVALNHTIIALKLIEAGADVNEIDAKGMSPLCRACHFGNEKLVKKLVAGGARVNLSRKIEQSPLWFAILCLTQCKAGLLPQYESVIRTLLCAGAEVRVRNASGKSPLHLVCSYMVADVVPIFVDFGARVDEADMHFRTPLFDCVAHSGSVPFSKAVQRHRQFAVAEQLLKAGCDDLDLAIWIEKCSSNAVSQVQQCGLTFLYDWCLGNVNRPLKLKNLCRLKLHDHFGGVFQTSLCVSYLDIPTTLRQFLCRETFFKFNIT